MTANSKWKIIVVSHSHWDREWYLAFQGFRIRLVGMLDRLLNIFASDPGYEHFMTDGQVILLEDYLEARPERRPEIERLVRSGRLLTGPWYVPPDEFLAGGEALIRNLQWGIRIARGFGGVMMVGYSPDAFGHIAHLPAILRGFGIEDAAIWRGTDEGLRKTDFRWESPDGSAVLTHHLAMGYGPAPELPSQPDALLGLLAWFRREMEPRASSRCLALPNGADHSSPQADLPAVIARANAALADAELVHGHLPMFFEKVRESISGKPDSLPRHRGELRSSQRIHLLPGTVSARMWVKQRNQQCEDLLARWTEPFSTWSGLLRRRLGRQWREAAPPPEPRSQPPVDPVSISGLLRQAWRQLLQNQDHDAICGCSVDAVHREMATRFDSCRQIGEELTDKALRDVAAQIDGSAPGVVVFNPGGGLRGDFVAFRWPVGSGGEPRAVIDAHGLELPCQVLSRPAPRYMSLPGLPAQEIEVGFVARDVPGYGYRAFRVATGAPQRKRRTPPAAGSIENEFFRVEADLRDGTITLHDKGTGRILKGLNRFVDGGDRGDEYAYWPPARDTLVDRPDRPPRVRVVEGGPARSVFEVEMLYRLPRSLARSRQTRARQTVACRIRSRASLYPGVRRVEFRTEVDNRSRDHRLRAHFPTDVQTDVSHAEQHFGVVTRPTAIPEADESWLEQPVGTYPQKSFLDVSDGHRGLMLANRGLPEYEVLPGKGGVAIALTLLRCVGWLCRGDMTTRRGAAGPVFLETPDAQCPGRHVFEYALVPHGGGWRRAFVEAHRFAVPMQARRSGTEGGALAAEGSLLEVTSSKIVLSALKPAEGGDGVVARLYNIDDRPVRARVRLREPHEGVELVNLNEERIGEATVSDGWVEIRAKRNEIISLLFKTRLLGGRR
jgi:mannosylglycerate hydrolase